MDNFNVKTLLTLTLIFVIFVLLPLFYLGQQNTLLQQNYLHECLELTNDLDLCKDNLNELLK